MGINLAWIMPALIVAGLLYALAEWAVKAWRDVGQDVYPGSPAHQQALATVDNRTAPAFTAWAGMSTADQAAWDEWALDEAARLAPPLPTVAGGTET